MVDKEFIRKQHFSKGVSIRELSRTFKMSRKTIRKFLVDSSIPQYTRHLSRPKPVTGAYCPVILSWLKKDLEAPKRQRRTAKRIYDHLVIEYDFQGAGGLGRCDGPYWRGEPKGIPFLYEATLQWSSLR